MVLGIGIPTMGIAEWIIILVIVFLLFGAKRLPEIGKGIGEGIKNFPRRHEERRRQGPAETYRERSLLTLGLSHPQSAQLQSPGTATIVSRRYFFSTSSSRKISRLWPALAGAALSQVVTSLAARSASSPGSASTSRLAPCRSRLILAACRSQQWTARMPGHLLARMVDPIPSSSTQMPLQTWPL